MSAGTVPYTCYTTSVRPTSFELPLGLYSSLACLFVSIFTVLTDIILYYMYDASDTLLLLYLVSIETISMNTLSDESSARGP